MSDPAEDIADALVTYVKAQTLTFPPLVAKTDDPEGEIEAENGALRVLFYPAKEAFQKIGRGGQGLEQFTVAMLVVCKLSDILNKPALAGLVREIKVAVRGQDMANCKFTDDETPVKFDTSQRHARNLFCSVSEFTYSNAG